MENIRINKENIHLFYEFMSDHDKAENRDILDDIIDERFYELFTYFDVNINSLEIGSIGLFGFWATTATFDNNFTLIEFKDKSIAIELFDIRDTLKPINEYIEEIKASSKYKEYIKSKEV